MGSGAASSTSNEWYGGPKGSGAPSYTPSGKGKTGPKGADKWKSTICRHWATGSCHHQSYSPSCPYAHGWWDEGAPLYKRPNLKISMRGHALKHKWSEELLKSCDLTADEERALAMQQAATAAGEWWWDGQQYYGDYDDNAAGWEQGWDESEW